MCGVLEIVKIQENGTIHFFLLFQQLKKLDLYNHLERENTAMASVQKQDRERDVNMHLFLQNVHFSCMTTWSHMFPQIILSHTKSVLY